MAYRHDVLYLNEYVLPLIHLNGQEYLRVARLIDTATPLLTRAQAEVVWQASARDLYDQRMAEAQSLLAALREGFLAAGNALESYAEGVRVAQRWVEEGDAEQHRLFALIEPLTRWQTPGFRRSDPMVQWEDLRSSTGLFDQAAEFLIRDDIERIRAEADRRYYAAAHAYDRALRLERDASVLCASRLKSATAALPRLNSSSRDAHWILALAPGVTREALEAAHLDPELVRLPGQGAVPMLDTRLTFDGLTPLHQQLTDVYGPKNINGISWDTWDALGWVVGIGDEHEAKLQFVSDYRSIIRVAAYQYGIPEELLAGIAYQEFGGKPMVVDDITDWSRQNVPDWVLRNIPIVGDMASGHPDDTSYGTLAIQVDTAARALGYDAENLSSGQRDAIIASLKDPEQCIMIAAKLLHDAKQTTDFALVEPADMTEGQLHQLAAVYNGGPDWAEAGPQSYADDFVAVMDEVRGVLRENAQ